ncbi:MAG: tRNA pseudouridine(55) synthase TruB [Syntrophomonadaceae bacterium]|jgi:tRNA pseudouridine55 synthase|nr:tRNA pseudouridine(55) synthase TruB [Bacillota bacterium]NLM88025.1 tRNA pseudouridine(55) synthase TruB [Syntrophomonadaceae bacterium]HAA08216.1 tRNA pseudouridine(55) synthase TruB [Syntrophomonas sp.]HQA49211.1 tRNA pseudouridine(55) synthase TruB [Syntrophomonadaceae bacterium]HQD89403.1 tRNA pseudouridine(55) synthase TruB [Syntrophomonadaceae bacterium]
MHGFLNINKPAGMTSFDVIRKLKPRLPKRTRIGHLGTLDPMATGVLPIAIGQATRIIPYVEGGDKEYIASMTLGGVSDTQDAWGEITYNQPVNISREQLEAVIPSFQGKIWQEPPMYSAVHHQGVRLYELARQGQTVERKKRCIEIKTLELLQFDDRVSQPTADLKVICSPGTYIRTLCHDIGQQLGTGAFLSALTRTRSGNFLLSQAVDLEIIIENWSDSLLLPMDYPLQDWPYLILRTAEQIKALQNGQTIHVSGKIPAGLLRVYQPNEKLLAITKVYYDGNRCSLKPERVFHNQ